MGHLLSLLGVAALVWALLSVVSASQGVSAGALVSQPVQTHSVWVAWCALFLSTWISLPSCGITTRCLVSVDGHRTPDLEGCSCILLTLLPGMYTQVEWAAPRVATHLEIF